MTTLGKQWGCSGNTSYLDLDAHHLHDAKDLCCPRGRGARDEVLFSLADNVNRCFSVDFDWSHAIIPAQRPGTKTDGGLEVVETCHGELPFSALHESL
jgi:hypothetical protein